MTDSNRLGLSEHEYAEFKKLAGMVRGEMTDDEDRRFHLLTSKTVEAKLNEIRRRLRLGKVNKSKRL